MTDSKGIDKARFKFALKSENHMMRFNIKRIENEVNIFRLVKIHFASKLWQLWFDGKIEQTEKP